MTHTDYSQTIDKKPSRKFTIFTISQTAEDNSQILILSQLRIQLLFVGFTGLLVYVRCTCWIWNSGGESNCRLQELTGVALRDRKHALHISTALLASPSWKYTEVQLERFLPTKHQFRAWFYTVAESNEHPALLKGQFLFPLNSSTFLPCSLPPSLLPRLPAGFGTHVIGR